MAKPCPDRMVLASGATARLTGSGERAVVCVNGGSGRERPGDWSATLEWLVARLAPHHAGVRFLEVRYRIRSWRRLELCIEDAAAALEAAVALGARELALLGFSMGGAVAISAAVHPAVSTVIGLAPWIPDRLDLSGLRGRRLAVIHGGLDGKVPGIPGVAPRRTLRGVERARAVAADVTHELIHGGVHGAAVHSPLGGLVRLPRAHVWERLVDAELRRFAPAP